MEHAVTQLVKALRYEPEGNGFDSHGNFHLLHLSSRTVALGSTEPLREMIIGRAALKLYEYQDTIAVCSQIHAKHVT